MPALTRNQGYDRCRGKEDGGIDLVLDFCTSVVGVSATRITDPERNRKHGDIEAACTAECKRQPISPEKYSKNFVEVMEDTSALKKPYHALGFAETCSALSLTPTQLAMSHYTDMRNATKTRSVLGTVPFANASLRSVVGSALTFYANPEEGYLYVYTAHRLLSEVRCAVLGGGLMRGAGWSNDDSFGVLVPISRARWRKTASAWTFIGVGEPPVECIHAIMAGEAA